MWRCRIAVRLFWYFWVYRDNEAETLSELSAHANRYKTAGPERTFPERRSMLCHYKESR